MQNDYYAHSLSGHSPDHWEPLFTGTDEGHLEKVAVLAARFAEKFSAADWGRLAGLWHDVGKYSAEFQAYLLTENGLDAHIEQYRGRVDHSTAGAQHAVQALEQLTQPEAGRILAYCIAGHHTGLTDADSPSGDGPRSLSERLANRHIPDFSAAPTEVLQASRLSPPPLDLSHRNGPRAAFQIAFFCRMLFSCLVDADFLATETFMSSDRARHRPRATMPISRLEETLGSHLHQLVAEAKRNDVFDCRQEILESCRAAATQSPGLFSLTVPTGGGKTLSSLAFALRHAREHGLDRVIYAIPFTSIIEQTADTFRKAFSSLGADVVLEHHTNIDPYLKQETRQSRLATENWDAPIVVTTNVQFFESLFASRTSCCRKLHRIARSVVILDEVQTLPVDLLEPCLSVLRELAIDYGCSLVLCTATQPAVSQRRGFAIGLENVHEIIADPTALYRRMKRVDVQQLGQLSDEDLTERLADHDRFLCIVNTRAHAARLYELLRDRIPATEREGLFHLSTLMCGEHRSRTIQEIRDRLSEGHACRVVSTQLIEAGVDVDFPVVYRALTGLDSIAQAAGRCNREGRLDTGTLFVFTPAEGRLRGYLKEIADTTNEVLPDIGDDLLALDALRRYFELHYWKQSDRWDHKQIMDLFRSPKDQVFQFYTASQAFRMIADASQPVLVPYGETGRMLTEQLRTQGTYMSPAELGRLKRRLQRYTVSLYENVYRQMLGGDIELLPDGNALLINDTCYDNKLGLRIDRSGCHEPESLIV